MENEAASKACQGLLGDYLECVVETVRTQHGLGHLQHRTQCPHVIARRGVKQVGDTVSSLPAMASSTRTGGFPVPAPNCGRVR
jgi:hypothetical protein